MADDPIIWDAVIKRRSRWTFAHYCAGITIFAADFEGWAIADKEGWTVAHQAAATGNLPEGFKLWTLKANDGITVREVYYARPENQKLRPPDVRKISLF